MKKIVGYWNPSVILTYVGMAFAVLGMYLAVAGEWLSGAYVCLIIAGICDLFDGAVARRVKRNEEEKAFGIELDSLVDVMSFIALPLTIFMAMGLRSGMHCIIFVIYAIAGIARLGYFNVATADENGPVPYYVGLPVTYVALVFPLAYLLNRVFPETVFAVLFTSCILVISALELLKVKIVKPRGLAYAFFALLAVVLIILYCIVI